MGFQSPISGSQTMVIDHTADTFEKFQSPISGSQTPYLGDLLVSVEKFQSPISGSQTIGNPEGPPQLFMVSIPYKRVTNGITGHLSCPALLVSIPYKRVTNFAVYQYSTATNIGFNPL